MKSIDRYIDFGLCWPALSPPSDDTLGLAAGVARISPQARGRVAAALGGKVRAPAQYLRSEPSIARGLFGATRLNSSSGRR